MTVESATAPATESAKRCAVLGSPIAHSLSPVMHRAAYRALGLDWTYEAVDTAEDELPSVLNRRDEHGGPYWAGLSLTMPLKRVVLDHVDERSQTTRALGVANTVVFSDGLRKAHNTDVPGAVAALTEARADRIVTARILGGGATAASAAYAVSRLGATHIEFRVRAPERAAAAAEFARGRGAHVEVTPLHRPMLNVVDVVVSTVPDSAIGTRAHELVDAADVIFDAVYEPWPTHLARAAQERGRTLIGGLDLLAHQAARQIRLMTGQDVEAQFLREAAREELNRRHSRS